MFGLILGKNLAMVVPPRGFLFLYFCGDCALECEKWYVFACKIAPCKATSSQWSMTLNDANWRYPASQQGSMSLHLNSGKFLRSYQGVQISALSNVLPLTTLALKTENRISRDQLLNANHKLRLLVSFPLDKIGETHPKHPDCLVHPFFLTRASEECKVLIFLRV